MDRFEEEKNAPDRPSKTETPEIRDYAVGYGKPPPQGRFKSGNSGNKKGRPRGSKSRDAIVRKIANEMHEVNENGQRRRRSTLELMLLALRNRAANGDVRAMRALMKYLVKFEPPKNGPRCGVIIVPAPMTIEEFKEFAEKENWKADAVLAARKEKDAKYFRMVCKESGRSG